MSEASCGGGEEAGVSSLRVHQQPKSVTKEKRTSRVTCQREMGALQSS